MSKKIVSVGGLMTALEAELAKNKLEAEGIPAFVDGDLSWGIMSGMLGGEVKVLVDESHAERALRILAGEESEDDFDAKAPASDSPDMRISTAPGRHPAPTGDQPFDPPVTAITQSISTPSSLERPDEESEDSDSLDSLTWTLDQMATRAFRAAVVGLFICPFLLHCYSIWVLVQLGSAEGKMTPSGKWRMYAAIIIDILVLGVLALVVRLSA